MDRRMDGLAETDGTDWYGRCMCGQGRQRQSLTPDSDLTVTTSAQSTTVHWQWPGKWCSKYDGYRAYPRWLLLWALYQAHISSWVDVLLAGVRFFTIHIWKAEMSRIKLSDLNELYLIFVLLNKIFTECQHKTFFFFHILYINVFAFLVFLSSVHLSADGALVLVCIQSAVTLWCAATWFHSPPWWHRSDL